MKKVCTKSTTLPRSASFQPQSLFLQAMEAGRAMRTFAKDATFLPSVA